MKVYENNARICLECHDINQFNQCQGKLYELYKDGIKGNKYVPNFAKFFFNKYRNFYATE